MAGGHSSYTTSLPVPAVTPENFPLSSEQCRMASLRGEKGTEDIFPARGFILRRDAVGRGGGGGRSAASIGGQ